MFINKKKKGYGWYSKVSSKDMQSNEEISTYINFSFKKDCEPNVDALEGDLYFIDKQGIRRKVFPVARDYKGNKYVEFKILDYEGQDSKMMGGNRSDSTKTIISPSELPFY